MVTEPKEFDTKFYQIMHLWKIIIFMNWLVWEKLRIDLWIVEVRMVNSAQVIDHKDLIDNRKLQLKFGLFAVIFNSVSP